MGFGWGRIEEEGGMAVRLSMFSGGERAGECRERKQSWDSQLVW